VTLRRLSGSLGLATLIVGIVGGALLSTTSTRAGAGGAQLVPPSEKSLLRVELHLVPDAFDRPHPLLMTVGGPIYCIQIAAVARHLHASRLCTDYGPNGYTMVGTRALRREDWGDPAYDAAVAELPDKLRALGVEISQLVVVGVSYSGYADAELVATHPELHPAALVVMDSFLDLPSRYLALPPWHETRKEIESVLGGTLDQKPEEYASRSPSHHLEGLAQAMQAGMKLVVTWSVNPQEQHEFNGATCSLEADAKWLGKLAGLLHGPVTGYVTELRHGHSLWDYGRAVLALAGFGTSVRPLPARAIEFRPGQPVPPRSVCTPATKSA
jgi:pimeloyl-ACP methyl ester carboxylesterase